MAIKRNPATGKIIAKTFSIAKLEAAVEHHYGFCRACGRKHKAIDPDARNYVCEACGRKQVFGAEELVLMAF